MNILTRYTRHRLPRPRDFAGDLFGAACLALIVVVPLLVTGG